MQVVVKWQTPYDVTFEAVEVKSGLKLLKKERSIEVGRPHTNTNLSPFRSNEYENKQRKVPRWGKNEPYYKVDEAVTDKKRK